MPFGVDPTGFVEKTLQDILDEIEDDERAAFGVGINTSPASVLGQLNGIVGDQLAELWEVAAAIYRSLYRDSASDEALDNAAALTGAVRLPSAKSTVTLSVNLDAGTSLPLGRVVSLSSTGTRFVTTENVANLDSYPQNVDVEAESENYGAVAAPANGIDTIETPVSGWTAQAALDSASSEPFALSDGETLLVSVDGAAAETATFETADFADIANATAAEIATVINTDITGVTAVDANGKVRIESDTDGEGSSLEVTGGTATALDFGSPASVSSGLVETFDIDDGQTLQVQVDGGGTQTATFNTADFVDIDAATAAEIATVINTDITGATASSSSGRVVITSDTTGVSSSVQVIGGTANTRLDFTTSLQSGSNAYNAGLNPTDASLGRDLESDTDFRIRAEQLLYLSGAGPLLAIRAGVIAVEGVTLVQAYENTTLSTDANGLPAKSFEIVAEGGTDDAIAQAIFDKKPAGIESYRDPGGDGVSVLITDSEGNDHMINFSRPTEVRMFVEVDVTVDGDVFGAGVSEDGKQAVREAIAAEGGNQEIGDNVIILRYQSAPLDMPGVVDVTAIKIEDVSPPTNVANIALTIREIATFDSADVTVNVTVA